MALYRVLEAALQALPGHGVTSYAVTAAGVLLYCVGVAALLQRGSARYHANAWKAERIKAERYAWKRVQAAESMLSSLADSDRREP